MKNLLFLPFLLLLVGSYLLPVTTAHASLTDGLVGYWTFDGKDTNWGTNTTNDLSGQGNTGTLTNMSTTTSPVAGKIGQGLKFDGSNDYVNAGTMTSTEGIGAISAGAWVYITAYQTTSAAWPGIVGKRFPGLDGPFGLRLSADDQGANTNKFDFIVRNSTNTGASAKSDSVPSLNTWYYVIGTYDGATVKMYVNGVLQTTTAALTGVTDSVATNLQIGLARSAQNEYFNGKIDDVRIYNRALSAGEVAQLYKQGAAKLAVSPVTSLKSGLVGYWTFDGKDTNWGTNVVCYNQSAV